MAAQQKCPLCRGYRLRSPAWAVDWDGAYSLRSRPLDAPQGMGGVRRRCARRMRKTGWATGSGEMLRYSMNRRGLSSAAYATAASMGMVLRRRKRRQTTQS